MFGYGIRGKNLKYIDFCLWYRIQRVAVNGATSEWAPVFTGVSQGIVLGPVLFSLYINDTSIGADSEIRLFADECFCYRDIRDAEDSLTFQNDVDKKILGKKTGHKISAC